MGFEVVYISRTCFPDDSQIHLLVSAEAPDFSLYNCMSFGSYMKTFDLLSYYYHDDCWHKLAGAETQSATTSNLDWAIYMQNYDCEGEYDMYGCRKVRL